jgi:hypothetical protein
MAESMNPMGLGGNLSDLISTIKGAVQNLSALNSTIANIFPRTLGTFTLAAATTTNVTQPNVVALSQVYFSPTNATGALILRTNGLFHATNTAGAGFTLSTQAGSAVAGGTFEYFLINPV